MRSSIELVAERRGAHTAVTRIRGGGHFAGRLTGPGEVHLIGTAAGPLGGDDVTISIEVGPGARLTVRSAAATIVLPSVHRPDSRLTIEAHVCAGGHLDLALEPTVVCHGAVHLAQLMLDLEDDARATIREEIVLGRSGEAGGDWTGRSWLTREGRAELRHSIRSRVLGSSVRAVATVLHTGGSGDPASAFPGSAPAGRSAPGPAVSGGPGVGGGAVALPLAAGGVLITSTAASLTSARAHLRTAQTSSGAGQALLGGPLPELARERG